MLLVVFPLNSSEKIEGHLADEKERTQLQISSNPLEVLLTTAFIEVCSFLGWVCGLLGHPHIMVLSNFITLFFSHMINFLKNCTVLKAFILSVNVPH